MTIIVATETKIDDLSTAIGAVTSRPTTVFDGMMEAQEEHGQIHWTSLSINIALGRYAADDFPAEGLKNRIAVIDTECADGLDIAHVVAWVQNPDNDITPDLSR